MLGVRGTRVPRSLLVSCSADRQPRPVHKSRLLVSLSRITAVTPVRRLHSDSQRQPCTEPVTATGGAGGGTTFPTGKLRTGGDDDDEDAEQSADQEVDAIFAKAGMGPSSLPADMQAALAKGTLSAEILRRWLALVKMPLLGALARLSPAFRNRVLGNPRFLLVLFIELAMGLSAKTSAEYKQRGDRFFKEINFVLSDLALEVVGDVAIVWLLSPKVSFKGKPLSAMSKWAGNLPGFALQRGQFPVQQRLVTFLYRGLQFGAIGFAASIVGHGATKYFVEKQEFASGLVGEKHLAPVLDNSIWWGAFMAASSNTRYQVVSTLEERLLDPFVHTPLLKTVLTFALRFGNTFVGGAQWVEFAALVGLQ
mmetsp:Transcript_6379/g.18369  ORF Transcript_6379/g.18369 Transcript_6379/m.18369 type:complete len:366 (-) Transcript_6379:765-1862(-)